MNKHEAVSEGVDRAFGFWLSLHPVSLPEIIEDAILKAFTDWLNLHSDDVIEAIAKNIETP